MPARCAIVLVGAALLATPAIARNGEVASGLALARKHCGACHALGKTGTSLSPQAPPFRDLHKRYPVEGLEEALAEGMVTLHPDMPEIIFEPDEIDDFIAYLKSLEP